LFKKYFIDIFLSCDFVNSPEFIFRLLLLYFLKPQLFVLIVKLFIKFIFQIINILIFEIWLHCNQFLFILQIILSKRHLFFSFYVIAVLNL